MVHVVRKPADSLTIIPPAKTSVKKGTIIHIIRQQIEPTVVTMLPGKKDTIVNVVKVEIDTVYLANPSIQVHVVQSSHAGEKPETKPRKDTIVIQRITGGDVAIDAPLTYHQPAKDTVKPIPYRSDSLPAEKPSADALEIPALRKNQHIAPADTLREIQTKMHHEQMADSLLPVQRFNADSGEFLKTVPELKLLQDSLKRLNDTLAKLKTQYASNLSTFSPEEEIVDEKSLSPVMDTFQITAYYAFGKVIPEKYDSLLVIIKEYIQKHDPAQVILTGYTDIQGGYEVNRIMTDKRLKFWVDALKNDIAIRKLFLQNFSNMFAHDPRKKKTVGWKSGLYIKGKANKHIAVWVNPHE